MSAVAASTVLLVAASASAGASGWSAARLVQGSLAATRRAKRRPLEIDDIVSDRVLCFAVFALAAVLAAGLFALWALPILLAVAWVLSGRAPEMLAARRAADLRAACDGQLDVMADIIALGSRAGLSFDASLDLYCAKFDGTLAAQMGIARSAWASGCASREQALADAADRVGSASMRRFAETVVQALRYGSPLADLMETLAADLRRVRRAAVEQRVAKAPVKMLVPLGTCILPALLIFVAGPVLLQFIGSAS